MDFQYAESATIVPFGDLAAGDRFPLPKEAGAAS